MNTRSSSEPGRAGDLSAFTLLELLVVLAILGFLSAFLFPAVTRSRGRASQASCMNNNRQLLLATTMYTTDHNEELPPRFLPTNSWPFKLRPYYINWNIIACPSDRFGLIRKKNYGFNQSYLINGFNDYFRKNLTPREYRLLHQHRWPHGMKISAMPNASGTLLFGEKRTLSNHIQTSHMGLS